MLAVQACKIKTTRVILNLNPNINALSLTSKQSALQFLQGNMKLKMRDIVRPNQDLAFGMRPTDDDFKMLDILVQHGAHSDLFTVQDGINVGECIDAILRHCGRTPIVPKIKEQYLAQIKNTRIGHVGPIVNLILQYCHN